MILQEIRTFRMPLLTNFRLLFLMMVFIGDFVVIGGIQEMRYTTSMVPNNSTIYTSGIFPSGEEYRTELAMGNRSSIQDALLLNTSYMSPDIVFKLRGSPETNRVLNTGNQSELQQLISTITFDERPRDVSVNRFDRSTDTTTTDIFKHNSSLNPKTEIEELVSLDLCRQYSSCEHVSNMTFKICHCDALCILYNDCCYNADIPDDSTVSKDLLFDCISPLLTSPWPAIKGYQVVKTCPKDLTNTEIDIKCQSDDIFIFGPWVITDSNIVFKNRFCAKCNNASNYKSFDIKFTNAEDTAKKNTPSIVLAALQDIYKERVQNSLVVEFIPPVAANLRQCVVYRNPKNESKNCLIYYTSPVKVKNNRDSLIVRNAFCIHPEDNVRGCVGQVGMLDSLDIGGIGVYEIFPMTVLFQFQQSCKGEFDVNGICLARSYEKYIEQDYSLVSSTNLSRIMVEEILTIMAWSFSDEIIPRELIYSYKVEKIDNLFYVKNVSITGKVIGKVSYEESINIDNHLKEANWLIRVSPKNGLTYEVNAMFVKKNDKLHSTGFNFNSRLNQLKADLQNNFEKKLCAKSIIECETWRDSDNSRTVIKDLTCVDFIQMQPTFASTNINMNVITYTGMGISVIALTASILVYRRLDMHRSIPGSNVENLSIALLISDIIFMLGIGANDLSLVCYSVGVALHYLWLLVFSFKCIALIHMCHTLTNMSLISRDIGVGTFSNKPCFTLLGLLLPFLFVVPAVLIDLLEVQGVSIDYSGSICFPTGYPGNLLFVSAPIGLAVVINITCLLCIAIVITKQSLGIRHIKKSNSFQYLPVFARISLVTGMLWITGLLGAIIQNEVMEYLFVICCSFQGLLIAVGNLTTKRIYRELQKSKQSLSK